VWLKSDTERESCESELTASEEDEWPKTESCEPGNELTEEDDRLEPEGALTGERDRLEPECESCEPELTEEGGLPELNDEGISGFWVSGFLDVAQSFDSPVSNYHEQYREEHEQYSGRYN
jgi:hypothetical protein